MSTTQEAGAPPAASRRRRSRARDVVIALLLGVVSILFVSLHVEHYTKLSPLDELQHIDYLFRSPEIVAPGDKVGNQAMRQEACRGVDAPAFVLPPCSPTASYDPHVFQEKGYNTAALNTPLYYSITHAVGRVILTLPGVDDMVDAGRLVGALWLWAGLVLTYLAGRRLGADPFTLLAVLTLAAVTPAVLFPSSTITPDAAAIAAGALMLWLAIWWEQQPRGWYWLLAVGAVLAALLKMTNVVAVCGCGAYLLLRWWQQRAGRDRLGARTNLRDYLVAGFLVVAAGVIPSVAWTRYVSTLPQQDPADLPDMATRFHIETFPYNGLYESLLALVNPLANPGGIVGVPQPAYLVNTFSVYLILSGLVAAAFFVAGRPRITALGQAWVLAAVGCAAGLITLGYVAQGAYFGLAPRYALALVPGMCLATAHLARHRFATVAIWAIALSSVALTFYRLSTAP